MAMDFKLKDGEVVRTRKANKASATVIEAGDMVALSSGLIIKGVAASAALAWCPNGGANGVTEIEVTVGNDFTLVGNGSAAAAVTDKGIEHDLILSGADQQIDLGGNTTKVLKVGIGKDSLTAGATTQIEVKINKPLF